MPAPLGEGVLAIVTECRNRDVFISVVVGENRHFTNYLVAGFGDSLGDLSNPWAGLLLRRKIQ